ncbi:MAG: DUF881 domain-containing protein [Candidatus Bruticola sp.]
MNASNEQKPINSAARGENCSEHTAERPSVELSEKSRHQSAEAPKPAYLIAPLDWQGDQDFFSKVGSDGLFLDSQNFAKESTFNNNSKAWQIPIAVACIILGIMVGLQYRAHSASTPIQVDDRRKMLELVRTLEAERNKMSAEISELRSRIADMETASNRIGVAGKQIQEQLNNSRIEAGLTGMKGPGIIVVLSDSPRTPPINTDPYFYIVHDVDLTALVNELWSAGAEAVSINEQRVVTRTSIRCVGPTVLVNGVRIAAPYTVKGIGPGDLETALRMPGGFLDSMAALISNGGQVSISRVDEVTIMPYEGSIAFRYSQSFNKDSEK